MDVKLDKQSKIPVYLQIVDQLRAQIMCGALPSGSVRPRSAAWLKCLRSTATRSSRRMASSRATHGSSPGRASATSSPCPAHGGGRREGEAGASDKPSRRVNWINEIKDRHLDMEKTFDDLFQRFTDESKYSLGQRHLHQRGVPSRARRARHRAADDERGLLSVFLQSLQGR